MFVRWRRRNSKHKGTTLVAELAESRRVNGKPRLQYIATLGSVSEDAITEEYGDEILAFWRRVDGRLERLDNRTTPEDKAAILEALEKRVPRVTENQLKQQTAALVALLQHAGVRDMPGTRLVFTAGPVDADDIKDMPGARIIGELPSHRNLWGIIDLFERTAAILSARSRS